MLLTDYLIVGAGAASMAFVDTIRTEQPNASIIIIDKHKYPGGHWNDAYNYVQLHQPSLLYGVSSKQMEGNWLKLLLLHWMLPWHHRANKNEILCYYNNLMNQWIESGNVKYYPECIYNFNTTTTTTTTTTTKENNPSSSTTTITKESNNENEMETTKQENIHTFQSVDGKHTYQVNVKVKFVNGVLGECRVPSTTPPQLNVGPNIQLLTPNQIYDTFTSQSKGWFRSLYPSSLSSSTPSTSKSTTTATTTTTSSNGPLSKKQYVVLGCGKTAMDTIVYLQRIGKIPANQIVWIIPNDVWVIRRDGPGSPWSLPVALLEHDLDLNDAVLSLEEKGTCARLDNTILPSKFRFPLVGDDELVLLQNIKTKIRRGRVTSITDDGSIQFDRGEPYNINVNDPTNNNNVIFVHCTSPGPFNGIAVTDLFPNDQQINLSFLYAPPVPLSMSSIAVLESRRINGTLDLEFGRKLLQCLDNTTDSDNDDDIKSKDKTSNDTTTTTYSDNEILRRLIVGYPLSGTTPEDEDENTKENMKQHIGPLRTIALFVALFDIDPMCGYNWLRSNRLSFFSIPIFKGQIYENLCTILEKKDILHLTKNDIAMYTLLTEKLKILEGR